jgi:hypothetical protein
VTSRGPGPRFSRTLNSRTGLGLLLLDAIESEYFRAAHGDVAAAAKDMLVKLARLYHLGGRHDGPGTARHHARFLLGAAEMVVAWCAELKS